MSGSKIFTRTILFLGFVSLFTDISSEMLYPVLPVYLKSIGYTALWIGLLEGMAEATSGLSKGYFGKLSDTQGRRMPFVSLGYFLSAVAKPLLVVFVNPLWILFCRMSDRMGKGIRTGARDAVLSDESEPQHRGKVFGFHRAMDTAGAAIGPLLALVWLAYHPGDYKPLFLAALLPALVGVGFTLLVKEKKAPPSNPQKKNTFFSFFAYWKQALPPFRKVTGGLIFFALFNSSDVFLLLMAKHQGLSDEYVILAYVLYNLVYALCSTPFGMMADKFGMRVMLCLGLLFFAITYAGLAFTQNPAAVFSLFLIYGLYAGATDGISKAWISKLVPKQESGTALGFLSANTSLATLLASLLTGFIWDKAGAPVALLFSASAAMLSFFYFSFGIKSKG
jgi:MFS family permease